MGSVVQSDAKAIRKIVKKYLYIDPFVKTTNRVGVNGRIMHWYGLYVTEEQERKIEKDIQNLCPTATIVVIYTAPGHGLRDGLLIRVKI